MSQQMDSLQKRNDDLHKKCRALETRVTELQDIGLSAKAARLENALERAKADLRDQSLRSQDLQAELERERADRSLDQAGHNRTREEMEKMSTRLKDAKSKLADVLA